MTYIGVNHAVPTPATSSNDISLKFHNFSIPDDAFTTTLLLEHIGKRLLLF